MTMKLKIDARTRGGHHWATLFLGEKGSTLASIGTLTFTTRDASFALILAALRLGAGRLTDLELDVDDSEVKFETALDFPETDEVKVLERARRTIEVTAIMIDMMHGALKAARDDVASHAPPDVLSNLDALLESGKLVQLVAQGKMAEAEARPMLDKIRAMVR